MYRPDDISSAAAAAAGRCPPSLGEISAARDCRGVGARSRSSWPGRWRRRRRLLLGGREGEERKREGEWEGEGRRAFMGARVRPWWSSGRRAARGNK